MSARASGRGLEGVVATTSAISSIIGATLTYRGYAIEDLVEHSTYEETVYLLWSGRLPTPDELTAFQHDLADRRTLSPELLAQLRRFPRSARLMDALRTAVSLMGMVDPEAENRAKTASWDRGVAVLARFPAAVAALYRLQQGLDPVEPDPELSQAANFLSMLTGSIPAASAARVMDQALIMHADHELNASTFTARVAASTLTDMYSAITAALCTLKGPLHGGAAEGVRRTLEEIEAVDQVPAWVAEAQRRKQRIMGFGHRIYREGDPRARLLKALSRQLADASGDSRWYDVSVRLEEEVRRSHGLLPNVDFYSASVYTYLGIPPELYTPIFAVGRVGGWIAHIMEQYADNRLIRPRAEYIGPSPRTYIDMEKR